MYSDTELLAFFSEIVYRGSLELDEMEFPPQLMAKHRKALRATRNALVALNDLTEAVLNERGDDVPERPHGRESSVVNDRARLYLVTDT